MTEQKRNNTKNSNNLSIIEYLKNKNSYPAIDLVRNNPEKAAMISKLVGSTNPVVNMVKRNNSGYLMSDNKLLEMSNVIKNRLTDNENIMQLFPDIELCAQILTSSILSPKDMVKTELIFNLKNYILPPSVSTKLLEKLKKYLNEEYDLEKKIPSILREALFDVGCYATAIIPEASVDSIINRNQNISIESLTEIFKDNSGELVSLGFLGNIEEPKNKNTNSIISLESFTFNKKINNFKSSFLIEESRDIGISLKRKIKTIGDNGKTISFEDIKEEYIEDIFSFIKITDNYNCLKLPSIIKHNNSLKTKQIIKSHKKFGMEAYDLTDKDIESLIYKNPKTKMLPIVNIKTDDNNKRKSIGKPLLAKLPSESIIPVYKPGNPNEHVAYFILIDEEGGFVSRASAMKSMNTFSNQVSNVAQPITSFLLTKARRNLIGPDDNNIGLDRIGTIYSTIVEKELIARIKNGTGGDVELGNNEEVYRIMLARTLANQFTRLLYIPAELVSYITFNYHLNGTGKGLLDDLKIIVSNRAILLFSEIMATSKNSIAQTKVNVTFDPNDPDPQKTADMIIDEVIRTRGNYYPLGVSAPIDLVDWVQRAGIMFAFEGHPGFPQTKLDFEAIRLEHTVPDSDLKENLRKQMYMHFGLSPETVDNGFNSEFATTEVAHNILFAKRTAQYQDIFTNQIEDYLKKIIDNDFNLLDELADIIKDPIAHPDKRNPKIFPIFFNPKRFLTKIGANVKYPP